MSAVLGRAFDRLSDGAVDASVDDLLAAHREALAGAESLVVLPSAHYPYHPSTGLVTNPTVVAAVVRSLSRLVDPRRLAVAVPGSAWSPATQVADVLGYPDALADTGAELVHLPRDGDGDLDGNGRASTDDGGNEASRTGTPPAPSVLEERVVVNVPTLRRCAGLGMVAGTANLGWATTTDPDADAVAAAAAVVDPAVTLLDGTYVNGGVPSRSRFLLASADGTALDRVCAALLGLDGGSVPYLAEPVGDAASLLDGVRLESIRADVRGRSADAGAAGPGDVASAGYRLYCRLTGDLVPPQLLGDVDG